MRFPPRSGRSSPLPTGRWSARPTYDAAMAGRAARAVVLAGLVGLVLWASGLLSSGPRPETRVAGYLAEHGLSGHVAVRDCGPSKDPERSVFDVYWCALRTSRRSVLRGGQSVPTGSSVECFIVTGDEVIPLRRAVRHDCFASR